MATAQSELQDTLALVSSLYGPGAITCWYLTTLSVLVSWTLHPRKRKSGSVDVDFIAVLTLPAVAAGHLVLQVRGFMDQNTDVEDAQSFAAIEASFNVTETFMAISVVLFIVAAWALCIRRAILVALIGLLCYSVECYVHFSGFMNLGFRYVPSVETGGYYMRSTRLFVPDFPSLVLASLVLLAICSLISAAIGIFMAFLPRILSSRSRQDTERANEADPRERMPVRFRGPSAEIAHGASDRGVHAITTVTTLFLPVMFVLSLVPPFWHSTRYHAAAPDVMSFWQKLDRVASRLGRDFLPRTACSIKDLDQGVAAAAGATVLGFSLYSVAKARYKRRNFQRTESTGTELSRLEPRPTS